MSALRRVPVARGPAVDAFADSEFRTAWERHWDVQAMPVAARRSP